MYVDVGDGVDVRSVMKMLMVMEKKRVFMEKVYEPYILILPIEAQAPARPAKPQIY